MFNLLLIRFWITHCCWFWLCSLVSISQPKNITNNNGSSVVALGKCNLLFILCFSVHNIYILGLVEISKALQTKSLAVLAPLHASHQINMNAFLSEAHKFNLQTCIFTNTSKYLEFIQRCQDESVPTSSLIFTSPENIVPQVKISGLQLCQYNFTKGI